MKLILSRKTFKSYCIFKLTKRQRKNSKYEKKKILFTHSVRNSTSLFIKSAQKDTHTWNVKHARLVTKQMRF